MGLSGRKMKQRIGADPRNLTWANDASKFGTSYLEKFGWASGSGLGVSGEGRTNHISVYQKLDMLGIGADHKNNEDGTAWKQGKDFENLLRRLNAGAGEEGAADVPKIDGFVRPSAQAEESAQEPEEEGGEEEEKPRKRKKRKHDQGDDDAESEDGQEEGRKKKKDKKEKKEKKDKGRAKEEPAAKESKKEKRRKREASDDQDAISSGKSSVSTTVAAEAMAAAKAPVVVPRPVRAHRARHIAMKGMASKSATAIAEILGVSSSPFVATPSLTDTPDPSSSSTVLDTPASGPDASAVPKMQDLTTSSKSVMDYFREKLAAKSNRTSESSTPAAAETPSSDDYDDRPRGGLGLGASRPRVETVEAEDYTDRPRGGLGSSKLSMSFVQSSTQVAVEEAGEGETSQAQLDEDESQPKRKSKKRKHKDAGCDAPATTPDCGEGFSSSVVERKKREKGKAPSSSDEVRPPDLEPQKEKKRKKSMDQSDAAVAVDTRKKRKKKHEAE
ncbi:hypothetical protein EVJ58_g1316 [Rhodofomes roseus]|uniref:PinX1-related protein 1 n=1 Tax=Rhodofomes roseus TaxID=34475 RepID=A0A4Y9Z3F2_9APHY|nr:hypothetical protein EVJ58_g1316 [Rhodofomes roseus]